MIDTEHLTVWQMMAAFASDEYELREVAPGEFEIVAVVKEADAETFHPTPDAASANGAEATAIAQ